MDADSAVRVEIGRDDLEVLLQFARIGDRAASVRSWRTWFRKHSVCSGGEREPDCVSCQAFTAAEALVGDPAAWDAQA